MAPLQDPRVRQTWNNIQHNAETATETAAVGIWTFTHEYINPCLASISNTLEQCTSGCFPDRDERARRLRERGRTRGRAEYSFDFYDDWDEEEQNASGGLLGWGNDELDRLLAGSGSTSQGQIDEQPSGRRRGMSYGTRNRGPRRMNAVDGLADSTVIPSTNPLGFLHKLPFKIGGTLRYKPSAADLKDHPGTHRAETDNEEGEPLIDDDAEEHGADDFDMTRTRARSSTTGSGDTSDSFRSRGDLFPSDGEDDAVPISDEFAMVLERRMTGSSGAMDDRGSGKTSSKGKRLSASRGASRTVSKSSDGSRPSFGVKKGSSTSVALLQESVVGHADGAPLTVLQQEEEQIQKEQDAEIERKREAAARLASERGLVIPKESSSEFKHEPAVLELIPPPLEEGTATEQESALGIEPSPGVAQLEARKEALTDTATQRPMEAPQSCPKQDFVPARLPNFK